ncbi:MAG: PH domain-containing protein [Oscillospiraceae bacterium]|nr:PH domain-containing protein [Oscillospiraceae bacterium]
MLFKLKKSRGMLIMAAASPIFFLFLLYDMINELTFESVLFFGAALLFVLYVLPPAVWSYYRLDDGVLTVRNGFYRKKYAYADIKRVILADSLDGPPGKGAVMQPIVKVTFHKKKYPPLALIPRDREGLSAALRQRLPEPVTDGAEPENQ